MDMQPVGPHDQYDPFSRSNEAQSAYTPYFDDFRVQTIFGWSEFKRQKCQKFMWTSVKTLAMHPVGPRGHATHFQGQTSPKTRISPFGRFSCPRANHFLGDSNSGLRNAIIFCGRPLRPHLCIRLTLTGNLTHFKDKRAPKRTYPPFRLFLCDIANHFLVDLEYDVKNAIFLWTSVKTLAMHPVIPHG